MGVARKGAGQCAGAHCNKATGEDLSRKRKNAVCQKSSLFKGFIEHAMDKFRERDQGECFYIYLNVLNSLTILVCVWGVGECGCPPNPPKFLLSRCNY